MKLDLSDARFTFWHRSFNPFGSTYFWSNVQTFICVNFYFQVCKTSKFKSNWFLVDMYCCMWYIPSRVVKKCISSLASSFAKVNHRQTVKVMYTKYSRINLILWHTQLIVYAEKVKSWFKSCVFPFTFQASLYPAPYIELCVY